MNWHTQLLFTQKIIIKQSSMHTEKTWEHFLILHGVPKDCVACIFYVFNIQHISFKIHQVIGFYFEYQSYVRNLHFFVQIFMYSSPISQHTTNSISEGIAILLYKMEEWNAH